jgi:hypothetical protein
MATSRDPGDHVLLNPPFQGGRVELCPGGADLDLLADVGDLTETDDADGLGGDAFGYCGDPTAQPSADAWPEGTWSYDDAADEYVAGFVLLEFQIVDFADELPVSIDHLAVQEVEVEIEHAAVGHGHCPAFV